MTQPPPWQPDPTQQPPGPYPGPSPYPPYGSDPATTPYPPGPEPGLSRLRPDEERNWAMGAHLGSFLAAYVALGLLAPLVVLLVKGNDSAFVRRHAVESLNFQLNAIVYTLVFFVLCFVLIGFLLLPLYAVFYVVVVILASVRASKGEDYRYPLTIRFIS